VAVRPRLGQWNFGAAALAWILFLIILVIGVINLFITRSLVRDEGAAVPSPAQMRAARRDAKAAVARIVQLAPMRVPQGGLPMSALDARPVVVAG
jgi:uncharacterized protein YbjT (DUF2867 family)